MMYSIELPTYVVDLRSTLNEMPSRTSYLVLPSANPTLPQIGEFSRSFRERGRGVNFRDRFHADEPER